MATSVGMSTQKEEEEEEITTTVPLNSPTEVEVEEVAEVRGN